VLLDEDLLLERVAIAHLHELVGVARIAVLAGKFAAAIGIDRPRERQAVAGGAFGEDRARIQGEVLHVVALAELLAFGGHLGDADELRPCGRAVIRYQRQGSHIRRMFA